MTIPLFKHEKVEGAKQSYYSDVEIKKRMIKRYHTRDSVRRKLIEKVKNKYRKRPEIRKRCVDRIKSKYHIDPSFRNKVIRGAINRYKQNADVVMKKKLYKKTKYVTDSKSRLRAKELSKKVI